MRVKKNREIGVQGIGSRKHRISGRVPSNKTNAMRRAREFNAELERKNRVR